MKQLFSILTILTAFTQCTTSESEGLKNNDDDSIAIAEMQQPQYADYREMAMNEYDGSLFSKGPDFKLYPKPRIVHTNRLDTINDRHKYSGLFERRDEMNDTYFTLDPINVRIASYEARTGASYYVYYSDSLINPLHIFRDALLKEQVRIKGSNIALEAVYPGQHFYFETAKAKYALYVTGNLKYVDSVQFSKFVEKIENVELHAQEKMNNRVIDSLIYKITMYPWSRGTYEQRISIHWIGDLDLDGRLDMVLGHSNHYAYYDCSVYLSSDGIFKNTDTFVYEYD